MANKKKNRKASKEMLPSSAGATAVENIASTSQPFPPGSTSSDVFMTPIAPEEIVPDDAVHGKGKGKASIDPKHWTVNDVVSWLKSGGYGQDVCDMFTENDVDGEVLFTLSTENLKSDIGIKSFGIRSKINKSINELRPDEESDHRPKRPRMGPPLLHSRDVTPVQRNVTTEILGHWRHGSATLPRVEQLAQYLETPLPERAKIPMTQDLFDSLLSPQMELADVTLPEDVAKLFRVSEEESAQGLWKRCSYCIERPPPGSNATENSFISFWDLNMRWTLELIVLGAESIRDSNRHMSTASLRPDYGLLCNTTCLFRGEEKSPAGSGDPRSELSEKMTFTYHPAPYVLGYYARGTVVTLVAICRPPPRQRAPVIVDIVTEDLRSTAGRMRNIVRLINIGRLIVALQRIVGPREVTELITILRDNKKIEVCGTNIRKTYQGEGSAVRCQRLTQVYALLESKSVPNIDHITLSLQDGADAILFLEPKGINIFPQSVKEVFEAIGCILEALAVMHEEPNPIFHRDIRWPNVIKCADDLSKWFLVDWEDAASPPTIAAPHLNPACHSPAVYQDNHGSEVDIWAVGMLIREISTSILRFPPELRTLGEDLKSSNMSAIQALKNLPSHSLAVWANRKYHGQGLACFDHGRA